MEKSVTISKLDVAKRQLETFIRLYFHSGDPVSMHTLVAAAHRVISGINENRTGNTAFPNFILENVKPNYRKKIEAKLSEAQHFFMPADNDHEASLAFNPDSTEFIALEACAAYIKLTGEQPPLFQIFNGWMLAAHPNVFRVSKDHMVMLEESLKGVEMTERGAFFKDMLQFVMSSGM